MIKTHSTGDNDSIEDVLIALLNVRDTEGKHVDLYSAAKVLQQFIDCELLASNPGGFLKKGKRVDDEVN